MLPASNKGPSLNFGAPDVCLTPVGPVIVPIPYPNFGAHAMAATFSVIVKAAMIPALNQASIIALTTGDEPGVAHWTVKGPGFFDMGSPIVMVEKLPGINLTSQTSGNTGNDQPGMVVAPGAPNVMYALAHGDGQSNEERLSAPPVVAAWLSEDWIGYVRIGVFSLGLSGALARVLADFERGAAQSASGGALAALVLDVRDCPGGELLAAIQLLQDFLPDGAALAIVRDADGDEVVHRSRNAAPATLPLVVLVNGGTASAAEIFAGALAHHGRALLVGEPTHGKGVAQVQGPAAGAASGAVPVTVASVLLPDGTPLQGRGVAPHLRAPADLAAIAGNGGNAATVASAPPRS